MAKSWIRKRSSFSAASSISKLSNGSRTSSRSRTRIRELTPADSRARSGATSQSFIAYGNGPNLGAQGGTADPSTIIDGALWRADSGNLFAGPSANPGDLSLGTGPLGAGSWAFWIQETGGQVSYTLDFVTVPEPALVGLLLVGGLVVGRRRRA